MSSAPSWKARSRTMRRCSGRLVLIPRSSKRSSAPSARAMASARVLARDDELGQQRVVVGRHHVALGVAGVDADALALGRAEDASAGPGEGRTHRVLGVDAELEGVAACAERPPASAVSARRRRSRSCQPIRSSAGGELGHRVLDLEPGVHLDEVERRRRRPGTPPCRRWRSRRPGRRRARASIIERRQRPRSCPSRKSGLPASSTTFWWRRWMLHSRSRMWRVPLAVAEDLHLDVAGRGK